MNGFCNNYDVWYIRNLNCLVNSISSSKQFCLSWSDVDNIMNSFGNCVIIWQNMWYWYNNVLDTSIRDDDDCIGINRASWAIFSSLWK